MHVQCSVIKKKKETSMIFFFQITHNFTVGKKSIRALEIFRVQKLILNATS